MKYIKAFESKFEDDDFDFITKIEDIETSVYFDELDGHEYNDNFIIDTASATIKWHVDFNWYLNSKDRNIGEGLHLSVVVDSVQFDCIYNLYNDEEKLIESDKECSKIYTPDEIKINIDLANVNAPGIDMMPYVIWINDTGKKRYIDITF